jgi:endoglucanase
MRKYLIFAAVGLAACGSDKKVNPSDPNSPIENPGPAADSNQKDPVTPVADGTFPGPAEAIFMGRGFTPDGGKGTGMAWAGSKVTVRVFGTDKVTIGLQPNSQFNLGKIFYNVSIDGGPSTRFQLDNSRATTSFDVALPNKDAHVVQWTKVSEPTFGLSVFTTVTPGEGGQLIATPVNNRKIEFIGDSIVNGYGILGATGGSTTPTDCKDISGSTDADQSFATLTAKGLKADYTLIAYSGRGLAMNNDGTTTAPMPSMIFDARPPADTTGSTTGTAFDTTKFEPDVVVINLGTNDFAGKLRAFIAGGGTSSTCTAADCNPDAAGFQAAYKLMLQNIRSKYAKAHVVCTSGPMLSDNYPSNSEQHKTLQTYINATLADLADANMSAFDFGIQDTNEPLACDSHPNAAKHQAMATALQDYIKGKMSWN